MRIGGDEIYESQVRQEYSRSFNHDSKAIFADLQKQQVESDTEFVNLSPKGDLKTSWRRKANNN